MKDTDVPMIVEKFADACRISIPKYEIVDKGGEKFIKIFVGCINSTYSRALEIVNSSLSESDEYKDNIYFAEKKPVSWLDSSESELLQQIIAQSLTVSQATMESDFHTKRIAFVGDARHAIVNDANYVVYGRRGAGKSTLLLYGCVHSKKTNFPFVWISMQQYCGRMDLQVLPQFLYEFVESLSKYEYMNATNIANIKGTIAKVELMGNNITINDLRMQMPLIYRELKSFIDHYGKLNLFIDDLHLLNVQLQPQFLSLLYSLARGRRIYLKMSAIENLTKLYDRINQIGLEIPGDAQSIRLDYNLVDPKLALNHISDIVNAYVEYVGIPSLSALASIKALERLVWVSAGVPRDALYIFGKSISEGKRNGRKKIAITDINMAAAGSMTEKQSAIMADAQDSSNIIGRVLDDIKNFCLHEIRCNAFLIRIDSDNEKYKIIKKICDLRFIHILHPGITPERAGEKYEVYMLDYAFYTGFRKAPSVKEYIKNPAIIPSAKELRKLAEYKYLQRIDLSS
jgi:hypothetical protein